MPWPSAQDYQEAVQSPNFCFADLDLQRGQPVLTPLGLPRPITGNFACVFQIQSGGKDWAVRCFLRESQDQQRRYAAISQYLHTVRLPYTVPFEFLPHGIRIKGAWYAVLKMEWIHGQTLSEYIEAHRTDRMALVALASDWLRMLNALHTAQIAHGDLQHGNVLLASGQLKIIDYDGMFVPALLAYPSAEIGHVNYQHPKRTGNDFGAYLDGFSAWVIYVALICLADDSSLHPNFSAHDEFLLFTAKDYQAPDQSPMLAQLRNHANPEVRALAERFRTIMTLDLRAIPMPAPVVPARLAKPATQPPPVIKPAPVTATQGDPSWIYDHLPAAQPGPPQALQTPASELRFAPYAYLLLNAVLVLLAVTGVLPALLLAVLLPLLAVGAVLLVLGAYRHDPAVRGALNAQASVRTITSQQAQAERALASLDGQRIGAQTAYQAALDTIAGKRQQLALSQQQEIDRTVVAQRKKLTAAQQTLAAVTKQRDASIDAARAGRVATFARIDAEVQKLAASEAADAGRELKKRQSSFIQHDLHQHPLRSALRPGGAQFILTKEQQGDLSQASIYTAADVSFDNLDALHKLDLATINALVAWKDSLQRDATRRAPTQLTPEEFATLRQKYAGPRLNLQHEREEERLHATHQEEQITQKHKQAIDAAQKTLDTLDRDLQATATRIGTSTYNRNRDLDQEETQAATTRDTALQHLDDLEVHSQATIAASKGALARAERSLAPYRTITLGQYLARLVRVW